MNFIEVEEGLTINLNEVRAFEKADEDRTRLYFDLPSKSSFLVNMSYDFFKSIVKTYMVNFQSTERSLAKIARNQYQPVP